MLNALTEARPAHPRRFRAVGARLTQPRRGRAVGALRRAA